MATQPDQSGFEFRYTPHLKFGLHISPKEMAMMSSFHLSRICQGFLGDNWLPWNSSAPWHKLSIVDIAVLRLMDASNPHYITLLGWQRRHLTHPPLPTVQIKTSRGENECFFNHMTSVCTKPFNGAPLMDCWWIDKGNNHPQWTEQIGLQHKWRCKWTHSLTFGYVDWGSDDHTRRQRWIYGLVSE